MIVVFPIPTFLNFTCYSFQIGLLDDYYLFVRRDAPTRSKREAEHHTRDLSLDRRVSKHTEYMCFNEMDSTAVILTCHIIMAVIIGAIILAPYLKVKSLQLF